MAPSPIPCESLLKARNFCTIGRACPGLQYMMSRTRYMLNSFLNRSQRRATSYRVRELPAVKSWRGESGRTHYAWTMTTSTARAGAVSALVLLLGTAVLARTSFSSVWKAPEATSVSFAGKTVAALVIDKDDSLRVAGEEALAAELTARGMKGVPSYRFVPKEELASPERAKGWFERAGAEGV